MGADGELIEIIRHQEKTWLVRRYGYIAEMEDTDGSLKYQVVVADLGRPPFIRRTFRRRAAAEDFYSSLMLETALPSSVKTP